MHSSDHYDKTVRARVTASSCFAVRLLLGCVARQPATACGMGLHLGGNGGGERLQGQNEPADPSDDCLGASGMRLRMEGRGCGAYLDRGDQRYQRKQARIVRRADFAVILAAAVGGNKCGFLLPAALPKAVAGGPVAIAVQVPPVVQPVGAVLGVVLLSPSDRVSTPRPQA